VHSHAVEKELVHNSAAEVMAEAMSYGKLRVIGARVDDQNVEQVTFEGVSEMSQTSV